MSDAPKSEIRIIVAGPPKSGKTILQTFIFQQLQLMGIEVQIEPDPFEHPEPLGYLSRVAQELVPRLNGLRDRVRVTVQHRQSTRDGKLAPETSAAYDASPDCEVCGRKVGTICSRCA